MALSLGNKIGPYKIAATIGKNGMGARDAPPCARKSDDFALADPNNSTKFTAFLFHRAQARS
jgi:hypothetical protein